MTIPLTHTNSTPEPKPAEPIAIIGAACRFSGNANTQDGLWTLLSTRQSTWKNTAKGRFKFNSFWHPHAQLSGSVNAKGLHLLNQDPGVFDNDFFAISGVESLAIDPNQRLMLEVAYEAFENAAVSLEKLQGSNTGVFCALPYPDYDQILGRDPEASPTYRFTGTGPSILANRISYCFDLRGPSFSVDTACSSSLVALHEACQSLRAGDAEQILVGGSNLILDPDKLTQISSMQFLSTDGRCYSFDARASGYGRGEGVAAILLKPLSAALRDGDTIRSVIRGSAIGSDGKTQGITLPSPVAQYETIMKAYKSAGLDPSETPYVEAHGTGTTAGDSTEITAFSRAFFQRRSDKHKLLVGSVKANLGHTEGVAGLASIMKAILMLENGIVFPNPNFQTANPALALEERRIEIPVKKSSWPAGTHRRLSINGTGYGGTNGHVILEAWPKPYANGVHVHRGIANTASDAPPKVFVWSHQREDGLVKLATQWQRTLKALSSNSESVSLDDFAFTLSQRSRLAYRVALPASDMQEVLTGLKNLAAGSIRPVKSSVSTKLCFIFTGQGAQWARMGLELLPVYPVFLDAMQKAEKNLVALGATWRLIEELQKGKETSRMNEAELAQPCTTAIQIALVDLLASWNIQPALLCGHSSGEIGAAYAAGALSAEDAVKVAYFRGQAVNSLKAMAPELQGGMLAVGLSETEVRKYLSNYPGVTVACINSPSSVTLSGNLAEIEELMPVLEAAGKFNRKLEVKVAYHSPHMAVVKDYYHSAIKNISPRKVKPNVLMVSSVTCREIQGEELDASYWTQNLLCPVRFSDALASVLHPRCKPSGPVAVCPARIMIEVGPHSALYGPSTQVVNSLNTKDTIHYASCLKRGENASNSAISLVQNLFCRGVPVALPQVNSPQNKRLKALINLPSYNWHHEKMHWNESRRSILHRQRKFPRHDLLGSATVDSISSEPSWRVYIRLSEMPWVRGHCIDGQIVYAASGFISMVIEAMKRHFVISNRPWSHRTVHIKDVTFERPLLIQEDEFGAEVFTLLRPYAHSSRHSSATWMEFRIHSLTKNNESTEHCRGMVAVSNSMRKLSMEQYLAKNSVQDKEPWTVVDTQKMYNELRELGNDYTNSFAALTKVSTQPWRTKCEMTVPDVTMVMPSQHQEAHCLHPTTLEACVQACIPGIKAGGAFNGATVVAGVDNFYVSTDLTVNAGAILSILTTTAAHGLRHSIGDFVVTEGEKNLEPLIQVEGMRFSSLGSYDASKAGSPGGAPLCHQMEWSVDPFLSNKERVEAYCRRDLVLRTNQVRQICDDFCASLAHQTLGQLTSEDESAVKGYMKELLLWMRSQNTANTKPMSASIEAETRIVGPIGELLVKHGYYIPGILRGNQRLLSLFNDDLFDRIRFQDECLKRCYAQLAEYIKLLQFKVPRLRILEIGGGTGGMACSLLEAVYGDGSAAGDSSIKSTYVFTDASESSTSKAKARLKKFEAHVEFKHLNLNQSPMTQDFEAASFDIIITSDVFRLSRMVKDSLKHIKQLLKPGGELAVIELVHPSARWNVLASGLEPWWEEMPEAVSKGENWRSSKLNETLNTSGFSSPALEMRDFDADQDHEASLLVYRLANTKPAISAKDVIIIKEDSGTNVAAAIREGLLAASPKLGVSVTSLSEAPETKGTYIFILDMFQDFLMKPTGTDWSNMQAILRKAEAILWVTKGAALTCTEPQRALITGLGRTIRAEHPHLRFYTIDLDPDSESDVEQSTQILHAYDKILGPTPTAHSSSEWEIAVREGNVMVPRLLGNQAVNSWLEDCFSKHHPRLEESVDPARALGLRIHSAGLLDSLYWADDPIHSQPPSKSQVKVQLENISLNFKDVMTAMGQLEGLSTILIEGSGVVVEVGDKTASTFSVGDRVGVFGLDGLATNSNIDVNHACLVPKGMSLESAAAIPIAYTTALYSLRDIARLEAGESVLIHSGAGAVGQAAITIAQYLGAEEIYVTAGSDERSQFIQEKFGIPAKHILSNRSLDFGDQVRELTGGRGVDVILNSLSGDTISASLSAMAPFGRFIEIGKRDILTNGRLEMKYFEKNVSFSVVDMTLVARERPRVFSRLLKTSIKLAHERLFDLIGPITTKHASDVETHFRTMQSGNHIGKLILNLKPGGGPLRVQPPQPKLAKLRDDSSYVVVGSTRVLHQDIAEYLLKLGAKRIVMVSTSVGDEFLVKKFVKKIEHLGGEVVILNGDLKNQSTLSRLKEVTKDMPIRGVIQGIKPQEHLMTEFASNVQWKHANACEATMKLWDFVRQDLDFFILLGSVAAVLGTNGQGNYCANNTFQDAFAQHLAATGFPVRAIDVGHVQETVSFETGDLVRKLNSESLARHSVEELLAIINYVIQNPIAETAAQAQILCGMQRHTERQDARPDARFAHISGEAHNASSAGQGGEVNEQTALQEATSPTEAADAVYLGLKQKLARLLALPLKEVQPDRSVASYGVDSLISIELRNWVGNHLRSHVQVLEIMSSMDMGQLSELIARRSRFVPVGLFAGTKEGK